MLDPEAIAVSDEGQVQLPGEVPPEARPAESRSNQLGSLNVVQERYCLIFGLPTSSIVCSTNVHVQIYVHICFFLSHLTGCGG